MTTDIVDRLRAALRTEINDHPGSEPDTPAKHRFVERLYAMIEGIDEIERLRAREEELCSICAMAYQVVGSMLSDLGQFGAGVGIKILDNLSQQKLVHDDVLPWPSFETRQTASGLQPERSDRMDKP